MGLGSVGCDGEPSSIDAIRQTKSIAYGDLYDLAIRLSSPDKAHKDYAVTDLDNGVRLFFWKGKLASSAVRSPSQV